MLRAGHAVTDAYSLALILLFYVESTVKELELCAKREEWTAVTSRDASQALSLHSNIKAKLMHIRKSLEDHFSLFWLSTPDSTSTAATAATSWMFSVDQWRCLTEGFAGLSESRLILRQMIELSDAHNFGRTLDAFTGRIDAAVENFNSAAPLSSSSPSSKPAAVVDDGDETRLKEINRLCETMLIAIQNIYNKYAVDLEVDSQPKPGANPEADAEVTDDFEKNHLTVMLLDEMKTDLEKLLKVDSTSSTLCRLVSLCSRDGSSSSEQLLLSKCSAVIDQYVYVVEYYFSLQLATLRASTKLLSVLLNVFNQLLEKGFCRPTELEEDSSAGSGTQFQENESGGLGDGDGGKDVSDQIENEDQLESAKQEGDEEEQEDQNGCKEEENGIEMSEDFKAQLQDKDEGDQSDNDDDDKDQDQEEDNLDKEMGETGDQADQLDEKLWGSDEEEDEDDADDAAQDEGQGDGQKSESQMTAKEGDSEEGQDDKNSGDNQKKDEAKQPDDNDEENVNDDHSDPYHSSHEPPPQPEPLEVPDDLNLDGADPGRDEEEADETEENPFDIDAMQEQQLDEGEQDAEGEDKPEETQTDETTDPSDAGPDQNAQGENAKEQDDQDQDMESDQEDGQAKDHQMEESNENDSAQTADPEQAAPSMDQPSEAEAQPATEEAVKGSQDRTANKDEKTEKMPEDAGQNEEAANDETEGVGVAESRQTEGHDGQEQSKINRQTLKKDDDDARGKGKPKKPGQSDPNRALADDRKQRILQVNACFLLFLPSFIYLFIYLFFYLFFVLAITMKRIGEYVIQ